MVGIQEFLEHYENTFFTEERNSTEETNIPADEYLKKAIMDNLNPIDISSMALVNKEFNRVVKKFCSTPNNIRNMKDLVSTLSYLFEMNSKNTSHNDINVTFSSNKDSRKVFEVKMTIGFRSYFNGFACCPSKVVKLVASVDFDHKGLTVQRAYSPCSLSGSFSYISKIEGDQKDPSNSGDKDPIFALFSKYCERKPSMPGWCCIKKN